MLLLLLLLLEVAPRPTDRPTSAGGRQIGCGKFDKARALLASEHACRCYISIDTAGMHAAAAAATQPAAVPGGRGFIRAA